MPRLLRQSDIWYNLPILGPYSVAVAMAGFREAEAAVRACRRRDSPAASEPGAWL